MSYDGIDINHSCKVRFKELDEIYKSIFSKRRRVKIRFIQSDILNFQSDKTYFLITASWCLGFFTQIQIKQILDLVAQILDRQGYFILKEQVNDNGHNTKGQHHYFRYTKQAYQKFFKASDFKFKVLQ